MSVEGRDFFSGGLLVYLNGVRLPAVSANVSVQVDSPASASVQIPANPIMYGVGDEDLLDLAIFYLDSYAFSQPTWCLLFEGRVTGQGYSNTPDNESMYLTAESNMNALSDLYINFVGKGKGSITSSKSYPNQITIKGKSSKNFLSESLSGRPLARPFDLIDNIYTSVFGSRSSKLESRLSTSVNKSVAESVSAKQKLLNSKFEKKAKTLLGPEEKFSGNYGSALQDKIVELQREWIASNLGDASTSNVEAEILRQLKEETKAASLKGSSTVVSGFFARYYRRIRSRNHWACSPYIEGIPNSDNPIKAHIGGGVFPVFRASKTKRYAKSMAKSSGAQYGPGGSALSLVKNIFGLYFYRMTEVLAPPAYTSDSYGLPKDKFNSKGTKEDYSSWSSKLTSEGSHLTIGSYLTHPSAPFSVPPMCNAIFPSMRTSMNINNSYGSKPTRLYYDKKSPYGRLDFSVNSSSYATDSSRVTFPSVIAGASQKAAGKATEEIDLLVFPEEYYRGPRPVPGQVHPTHMDIKKYAGASRFGTEDKGDPAIKIPSVEGMTPEEAIIALESVEKANSKGISSYGLYYLLARKDFLSRKYGSVSGDISMLFNPYLLCGFPAAVLGGEKSGMHFYGEVVSINHSLSVQGHSTSVQLGTVRDMSSVIQGIVADGGKLDSYPQEPVEELRDLLQVYEHANEYYTQVLKKDFIGTQSAAEVMDKLRYDSISEDINGLNQSIELCSNEIDALDSSSDDFSKVVQELRGRLEQYRNTRSTLQAELAKLPSEASTLSRQSIGFPAAFDFKSFLGWRNTGSSSSSKPDYIVLDDDDFSSRTRSGLDTSRTGTIGFSTKKLVPLPEVARYYKSTANAMKLVSRPVCTLEQYIDFYSTVDLDQAISSYEGRGRGCRLGQKYDSVSGAAYYDVIRQYIGGPGIQPGTTIAGKAANLKKRLSALAKSSDISESSIQTLYSKIESEGSQVMELSGIGPTGSKVFSVLGSGDTMTTSQLPDSRRNWQKLLLDYLTIIEGTAPLESEG